MVRSDCFNHSSTPTSASTFTVYCTITVHVFSDLTPTQVLSRTKFHDCTASCYLSQIDAPLNGDIHWERWDRLCDFSGYLGVFGHFWPGLPVTQTQWFTIQLFQFLQNPFFRGVHPHTGVHLEQGEDPVLPGKEEHQESGVLDLPPHSWGGGSSSTPNLIESVFLWMPT